MAALTIPTVPVFPAGYVAQLADLQNLTACCSFLLEKPMTKIVDTSGGVSISDSTGTAVTFSSAQFDVDGMWNASTPTILTIQTPGWYKVRYGFRASTGSAYINSFVQSASGPDNPEGGGVLLNAWLSSTGSLGVTNAGAAGLWPQYLYTQDTITLKAQASTTGVTTSAVAYNGSTAIGSYLSLEFVSAA